MNVLKHLSTSQPSCPCPSDKSVLVSKDLGTKVGSKRHQRLVGLQDCSVTHGWWPLISTQCCVSDCRTLFARPKCALYDLPTCLIEYHDFPLRKAIVTGSFSLQAGSFTVSTSAVLAQVPHWTTLVHIARPTCFVTKLPPAPFSQLICSDTLQLA